MNQPPKWEQGKTYSGKLATDLRLYTSHNGNRYHFLNLIQDDQDEHIGLPIDNDQVGFLQWCGIQQGSIVEAYCYRVVSGWPYFHIGRKDIFQP